MKLRVILEFVAIVAFTLVSFGLSGKSQRIESVQAQASPAIRILTDNLIFTVTGSGIGSATQAKVSYQTQKVYVNGIKLQNTTSTPQQFNLEVGFNTTRTNVVSSPRLIGAYTGYDGCGGFREFRGILNPNETRAVPNNLACADIAYYASQASNNLFQLAAVNGTNSADLIIRISPAHYNNWADNFKKVSNALIWPAAKITVNDLLPNPSTYYMSLRMQDGSTRPNLQKTLFSGGGSTQYFGGAILNTPGQDNKYTVSRNGTSSSDQIALGPSFTAPEYTTFHQETVSATKPWVKLTATPEIIAAGKTSNLFWESGNAQTLTIDNGVGVVSPAQGSKPVSPTQTTTYTITATGPGGSATASAKITVGLPDLVIDTTTLTTSVDGVVGSKANVSASTKNLIVTGIKIKNAGNAALVVATTARVGIFFRPQSDFYGEFRRYKTVTVPPLAAGGIADLGPVDLTEKWVNWKNTAAPFLIQSDGSNTSDLEILINPDKKVAESNFDNNNAKSSKFFTWPTLIVTTHSKASEPLLVSIEGNQGSFEQNTLSGGKDSQELNIGKAYFPVLPIPNKPGDYRITISLGDEASHWGEMAAIKDFQIYNIDVNFQPTPSLVVKPELLFPNVDGIAYNPQHPYDITKLSDRSAYLKGDITLEISGTQAGRVTKTIDGSTSGAKFTDWTPGSTADVIAAHVTLTIVTKGLIGDQVVHFDKEFEGKDAIKFSYNSDEIASDGRQTEKIQMRLTPDCSTTTGGGKIKICIYDDPEHITDAKKTWLPVVSKTLDRMTKLPGVFKLTEVKEYWAIVGFAPGAVYVQTGAYIFIDPRLLYLSDYFASVVTVHEAMHAIDYQLSSKSGGVTMFSREDPTYPKSVKFSLESDREETAWKQLGWTCAYAPPGTTCGGYSSQDPFRGGGPEEVWAEQMAVACTSTAELKRRVQESYAQGVPSSALVSIVSRSIGDPSIGRGNVVFDGYNGNYTYTNVPNVSNLINACESQP